MKLFSRTDQISSAAHTLFLNVELGSVSFLITKGTGNDAMVIADYKESIESDLTPYSIEQTIKLIDATFPKALNHLFESLTANDFTFSEVVLGISPTIMQIEEYVHARVHESPQSVEISYEQEIDDEVAVIHREIRDLTLNGYALNIEDLSDQKAKTVEYHEEIHLLEKSVKQSLIDVTEKHVADTPMRWVSMLGAINYALAHRTTQSKQWSLLYMDHEDSVIYKRDTSTKNKMLTYGMRELLRQMQSSQIGYDDLTTLSLIRISARGDLSDTVSESMNYVFDIERSVLEDAIGEIDRSHALYIVTPEHAISKFLAEGMEGSLLDLDISITHVDNVIIDDRDAVCILWHGVMSDVSL